MGTMGEVGTDFSQIHGTEEEWMEQQSSARLFERSRIKVLAGNGNFHSYRCAFLNDI